MEDQLPREQFEKLLYGWYAKHGRDLPWRHTTDPYKIWVSEIMLQQTQVERVKEYYVRFLEKFPDLKALATASWEDVLDEWRGLGYYRRARNLHAAAQVIQKECGGVFPPEYRQLRDLPGIGSYTAAAISCFAFGDDMPAIDTNVEKVFAHVFEEAWKECKPAEKGAFVSNYIGEGKGAAFHHAIMDVGSALSAGQACPFHSRCEGIVVERKRKHKGLKGSLIRAAIGVLIHDGKVLIAKRKKGSLFGGYWEFPGGKLEEGEDERNCLKREMMEEMGIEVSVRPYFHRVESDNGYLMSFHRCSLLLGEPQAKESDEFCWVTPAQLSEYQFPPMNDEVISILQEKKAMFRV